LSHRGKFIAPETKSEIGLGQIVTSAAAVRIARVEAEAEVGLQGKGVRVRR
jgi:hypothetical protein